MITGHNILQNKRITTEVDPNPNGLPILWLCIMEGSLNRMHAALSKEQLEALVADLQRRLAEL